MNGLDAAMALRAASGGALRTSATPTQALALGAALTTLQRQHRRADLVDLLGAYAAAGGFAWMTQRRPTTAWLLERDGGNLADAIEQALAWDAAGRGAVAARAPPHRVSDVRRGRLEAADAEAFAQVDDATLFGRDRPA
ncbi:MAG TPA: hypothetical protein VHH11_14040 [Gammaproteobacteria bacterium]|nr:hypothetical protein [Gammaproteobacteria bacterium]